MTSTIPVVSIHPIEGLPEILPGDDLPGLLAGALRRMSFSLADGDVIVVAQKVVSKAEGARVALDTVEPTPETRRWAEQWGKDPRMVELVLRETRRIVRRERGLIISETRHGFVCANAGIDLSNSGGEDLAILLPEDSDRSAGQMRQRLAEEAGAEAPNGREAKAPGGQQAGVGAVAGAGPRGGKTPDIAVIVSDTFGRPWRVGLTQVALGVAGLEPLLDLRESPDVDGRTLHATIIAVADELACAADLVCGKITRVPAAVIRGYPFERAREEQPAGGAALIRDPEMDLFR
ncbi:MAG: coenzyme F420-0:L-glutamate ligase [bacterium]